MSQFVTNYQPYEKLSPAHQHRCSILIEHEQRFFEVKGKFFKQHPMKIRHKIEWWMHRRDQVKKAACWRAKRLMSGVDLFTQRYEYLATVVSAKIHRHVVVLRLSPRDVLMLEEQGYLREIPVSPDAGPHARARAALFGISVFSAAGVATAAE